ncbi:hypothetical protein LZ31DRAFT_550455 [Colletotrichum somersetense]|nr:hypothetical protein LZ31DRAFT_550455 [Colletotrichum somersetense]
MPVSASRPPLLSPKKKLRHSPVLLRHALYLSALIHGTPWAALSLDMRFDMFLNHLSCIALSYQLSPRHATLRQSWETPAKLRRIPAPSR